MAKAGGYTGACLCGGVRYAIRGTLDAPVACHCSQCARTSGHHAVMACCADRDLDITAADTLRWYASSANVKRGFCERCGGNLFWKDASGEVTYVTAGTLDRPTGLRMTAHIFAGSRADYDDIDDDLPRSDAW